MKSALFASGSNSPGMLVTVDGPNGSGKSFLTRAIEVELRNRGAKVYGTQQPSASELGRFCRDAEVGLSGRALACLVAADRHQQTEGEIADHLQAGEIVLCDRYVESSLVLQRIDGVEVAYILQINSGIPRPDLRISLRASPEVIRARLSERSPDDGRRFEKSAGPELELKLYAEAERLLATNYGLPSHVLDTSNTTADELGAVAAQLVWEATSVE